MFKINLKQMKIIEQKPNMQINSFIPTNRISGINPTMRVKSFTPKAGMEKSTSQSLSWTIVGGTPIGLLLALTYASAITNTTYSRGISPNAKIITY